MFQHKTLVVLDAGIPALQNNKIFQKQEAAKVMHTILPICFLAETAQSRNIDFVTPDVFFLLKKRPEKVFLMSHGVNPETPKLISAGVCPLVLFNQESPYVATKFYAGLLYFSRQYKHTFVFSGARKWVSSRSIFHEMRFPQAPISNMQKNLPNPRKFLVFIVGRKYNKKPVKDLLLKLMYGFGVKEINSIRREIVNFFGQKPGFDLYGLGWEKAGSREVDGSALKKCYRGPLPYGVNTKHEKLSEYKFTICFENAIFPGYVTEKIFDALLAGSIPVYLGAPDIEKYVPKKAFIDFRDFGSLEDLYAHLSQMSEQRIDQYRRAIWEYLVSEQYRSFTQEVFAEEILKIIEAQKI